KQGQLIRRPVSQSHFRRVPPGVQLRCRNDRGLAGEQADRALDPLLIRPAQAGGQLQTSHDFPSELTEHRIRLDVDGRVAVLQDTLRQERTRQYTDIGVVSEYRYVVGQVAGFVERAQGEVQRALEVAVGAQFLGRLAAVEMIIDPEERPGVCRLIW